MGLGDVGGEGLGQALQEGGGWGAEGEGVGAPWQTVAALQVGWNERNQGSPEVRHREQASLGSSSAILLPVGKRVAVAVVYKYLYLIKCRKPIIPF